MEKIIVLVTKGKGDNYAYATAVFLFDTNDEANSFIENVKEMDTKYWTNAMIVNPGEDVHTHYQNEL